MQINSEKNDLRELAKQYRRSLSEYEKDNIDLMIFKNLKSLGIFSDYKNILCYMSTSIEVETQKIIEFSFNNNINLCIPKCVDNSRNIKFYLISSLSQTKKGAFGILEPDVNVCVPLKNFENSVCIVPGLSFDKCGYRLGYGKGYYDRFLSSYNGKKIGLCYQKNIFEKLPHGFFDKKVDIIVTEKGIIYI